MKNVSSGSEKDTMSESEDDGSDLDIVGDDYNVGGMTWKN